MTETHGIVVSAEAPAAVSDASHPQRVHGASGLLAGFNAAGVLGAADVHVAHRLGRLTDESDDAVLLAVALAVRAVRLGSVCLDLATARESTAVDGVERSALDVLAWPDAATWSSALADSTLVGRGAEHPERPLRLDGSTLYLDRYWRQEKVIADALEAAAARSAPPVDADLLGSALARLFPATSVDRQRLAAVVSAHRWISVVAGGPGTGKTTTVAKLLALLQDQHDAPYRIALAAPTGRAAARLQEAVGAQTQTLPADDRSRLGTLGASTLHRLLGSRPGARTRFRHDRRNPLPYDVVVVDEASMVSLTMMSRLVDALRSSTRLILVGDPDQLASVEAGAVLGDLVAREAPDDLALAEVVERHAGPDLADLDAGERHTALSSGAVRLAHVFRFSEEIRSLADAVRLGDVDRARAALDSGGSSLSFVNPSDQGGLAALRQDVVRSGTHITDAARRGDAEGAVGALDHHRLLCAHRAGPYGVARWSRQVEDWLGEAVAGYGAEGLWYVGRPLLVTANDHQLRLYNGDTGVVVEVDGETRAAFRRDGRVDVLPTNRLGEVQTMHAMSVHRSQGSQFDRVTVVLPPEDSPLLTRELFYTAITRAKEHVRVVGTPEALARAVRRPVVRASGLRTRRTG